MQPNSQEQFDTNYQNRYHRKNKNGVETKPLRTIKNYNTERLKYGTYNTYQQADEFFTEHSYDAIKPNETSSNYTRHKKSIEENLNNNIHNINYKNRTNNNQAEYKVNSNDVMRINTITYYSEKDDVNKGRSSSTIKRSNNMENTLSMNNKLKKEEKNVKSTNRIELDNGKKNNDNLVFINTNKNTSIRYINKTKNNNTSNANDGYRDIIIKNNRRKNKNEIYISESNLNNNNNNNNNNNSNNYINDNKSNEKEYKFNKHSTKVGNNNKLIKMSNFEISYESDKGERNTYNSYKKNKSSIINNNSNYNNNNYNQSFRNGNHMYYSNINLDKLKNNNNDDTEIYNNTVNSRSNINNLKNNQYKYQIVHNNSSSSNNFTNNVSKKRININDSVEMKDLRNNKSVSIVSSSKKKNIKSTTNINSRPLKSYKSNVSKNNTNKMVNSNYYKNNNSIDIIDSNSNNNNNVIIKNDIYTNMSIESPIIMNSINLNSRKNINNTITNNNNISFSNNSNLSDIKRKSGSVVSKKIKYKSFHRQSDLKKIIYIQSIFRGFLLRLNLSNDIQIYVYFREFFELIYNILYIRKINYWKYFIQKLLARSTNKLINRNKKKKNSSKNKIIKIPTQPQNIQNQSNIPNTNKKLILKTNEVNLNLLHKELGDSFNIINDNNGLKLKLDEMIKENNELKNQIFDNKNIEERLQQLLVENKKNQNINTIIMKDNQQLAKKLKNIQENRNNQLVIQNQSSLKMGHEDNLLWHSITKLKYLHLKILVFKKILKIRGILKTYFNKYRNNVKKIKNYKIENNNIFINNKKKINIQMGNNFNINYISQNDNYKHFLLHRLFIQKEKNIIKIFSKYFYKYFYLAKCTKITEKEETEKKQKEEELIQNPEMQKKNILQSIIDKYERNYVFKIRKTYKEWRLRGVIFKMKAVAKEIKKKKKLKKKIRDKIAKETLNNLKNKTAMFQSAHEFSYKIDKTNKKEDSEAYKNNNLLKSEDNKKKEDNIFIIKEEEEKNNNNDEEDSEESFGLDE